MLGEIGKKITNESEDAMKPTSFLFHSEDRIQQWILSTQDS